MDYEVGSVADLISGTITPNRPKLVKRASTPTKHKKSPNVTPKSDPLLDRSPFLSPSLQRRKAIVKKSPKRIFQDDNSTTNEQTAKADQVKKHLVNELDHLVTNVVSSPKKAKGKKRKSKEADTVADGNDNLENYYCNLKMLAEDNETTPRKKKKNPKKWQIEDQKYNNEELAATDKNLEDIISSPKSKHSKKKNKNVNDTSETKPVKMSQNKSEENSDSEHLSDDDIESENEEEMKNEVGNETASSDDEIDESKENKIQTDSEKVIDKDEVKRTLFVGNVPLSKKTKKELKKIFSKYGTIENVRIRNVPVKDSRLTPKLAIIKNEIHPDKATVNCYIKFSDAASVNKALAENNSLMGVYHLRVDRSDTAGLIHDPRKTLFVGNMPLGMQDDAFRALFEKCGVIESVRIVRDKKTQVGKGFGFVNFASADGVELALMMEEKDITVKNRILRLKRYTNNVKTEKKPNKPKRQVFQKESGAFKRIHDKKRKLDNPQQNNSDEPNMKRQKKEFVGITANSKNKKKKFNKGLKQQKKLSKILTNNK